jgi:hypothetical protein
VILKVSEKTVRRYIADPDPRKRLAAIELGRLIRVEPLAAVIVQCVQRTAARASWGWGVSSQARHVDFAVGDRPADHGGLHQPAVGQVADGEQPVRAVSCRRLCEP